MPESLIRQRRKRGTFILRPILPSILSRVTVTKDGVRIGNRFIKNLQIVTTNNYNTVTDFHTTKHSTLLT
jgi:hypothetical protein